MINKNITLKILGLIILVNKSGLNIVHYWYYTKYDIINGYKIIYNTKSILTNLLYLQILQAFHEPAAHMMLYMSKHRGRWGTGVDVRVCLCA